MQEDQNSKCFTEDFVEHMTDTSEELITFQQRRKEKGFQAGKMIKSKFWH